MPGSDDDPVGEPTPVTWVEAGAERSATTDATQKLGWSPMGLGEARSLLELALGDLAPDAPVVARDRYSLQELLGRGGMGEVRVAHDQRLRRDVALKTLRMVDPDPRTVARFLQEAQITGQLEHPGIVAVHDVGVDEAGTPFFTMRRIAGSSLAERMEAGDLGSLVDRLDVFKKVCDAVAFAHSRGVVHSDLKPSNVMVGPFGEVVVLDWGIAKIVGEPEPDTGERPITADSGEDLTRADAIMGTPSYMSPEQARGERDELGPPSDIYCLGALLYALLTGSAPFRQPNARLRLHAVATGDFVRPRGQDPTVPVELDAIVCHAMALDAADRYATALALRDDVQAYLDGQPVSVVRYSWFSRGVKWLVRHRRVALPVGLTAGFAVVLGIVGAVVGGSVFVWRITEARDRAVQAEHVAEERYADGLISQAVLHAEGGHAPAALVALDDARRILDERGVEPLRADVVGSYVRLLRPPPVVTWTHPDGQTTRPILRPDGKQLLSTDEDGTLRLHELPAGTVIASLSSEVDGASTHAGFQGDRAIAGFVSPHDVRVVDVASGEVRFVLPRPSAEVDLRFRVHPTVFSMGSAQTGLQLFDVQGGPLAALPDLGAARALSDDATRVLGHRVVGSMARAVERLELLDVATGDAITTIDANEAWLSHDGRRVLVTEADEVRCYDGQTGALLWRTPMPEAMTASFASDDQVAVVSTFDGWARWIRIADGVVTQERRTDGRVASLARDGEIVALGEPSGWSVWWSSSPSPWLQVDHRGITAAQVTDDGELLLTGGWSGQVRLWHWATGRLLLDLTHGEEGVRDVAFLDGGRGAVSAGRDGSVVEWDLLAGERVATWTAEEDLGLAMAALPLDETRVIAVYERGDIRIWNRRTGTVDAAHTMPGMQSVWDAHPGSGPHTVLISGRGDRDPAAVELDWTTGVVRPVVSPLGAAYQVDLAPDGASVAVATHANRVRLHTIDGSHRFDLDSAGVTLAASFSPDGRLLASGNYAGEVQVWDARSGALLLQARLHSTAISRIVWAGTTLLTFGGDGAVHRFDLAPAAPPPTSEAEVRLRMGREGLARGAWSQAVRMLQRAQEEGSEVPPVLLARAHAADGQADAARAAMARAAQAGALDPVTAEVWGRHLGE